MKKIKNFLRLQGLMVALALLPAAFAQTPNPEIQGVEVQIKSIAEFRGIVRNQLVGVGLVTGLAGTGDTKRFLQTQRATINLLRGLGIDVDATQSESKNVALVTLTAELPPFSTPGARIDVTASAVGDCTDLRGGTLMFAPLKYPGREETYATASGAISVGGSGASAGGNTTERGFRTVGKLPGGAQVERSVPTVTVFDGKMYLDLRTSDATTAARMENAINNRYPEFHAYAYGAGTVVLDVPPGVTSNTAQARIGAVRVFAETEALIVIDEKTGTIVMGGDIRVAPCAIAKGSLSVRITSEPFVSQPAPFSQGQTVAGSVKTVDVKEQTAQIATLRTNTSVADLAAIFQALRLKADDVINILKALHEQGALKARLEVR